MSPAFFSFKWSNYYLGAPLLFVSCEDSFSFLSYNAAKILYDAESKVTVGIGIILAFYFLIAEAFWERGV